MSSIYRKGRDGYYYYQPYVLDPKTGKKNKRIFHSLGTKEKSEAELKQNILDKKYEKSSRTKTTAAGWINRYKNNLVIIAITTSLTLILSEIFNNVSPNESNIIENINNIPEPIEQSINDDQIIILTDSNEIQTNEKATENGLETKIEPVLDITTNTIAEIKLPDYKKKSYKKLYKILLTIYDSIMIAMISNYWLMKTKDATSYYEIIGITGGILQLFHVLNLFTGTVILYAIKHMITNES